MKILENADQCCGCHACYDSCPAKAIEMRMDSRGFLYPYIIDEKCIQCRKCQKVCPIQNIPALSSLGQAYGCYARSSEEHASSSSGGVFSVLARQVLSSGGAVCGAAFDKEHAVVHTVIENECDLRKLKETKYVQSSIGTVYSEIKELLKSNRLVLFSGMSCQVAGLKNFLGAEYSNLICVDLICHGVPSPGVWKRYLDELTAGKTVENVTFRNKIKGISSVTLDYHLENGTTIQEAYSESPYIKGFIQNLYIRPSCTACHFKGVERCSDITIGDFWGIDEFHPGFSDGAAVSAVIINTQEGAMWFREVQNQLVTIPARVDEIKHWNSCLYESVTWNKNEDRFFELWNQMSVKETISLLQNDENISVKSKKTGFLSRVKGKIMRWSE